MRVSDQGIRLAMSRDLQSRLSAVSSAQRRAATGLRVETASDAPADAARLVGMDSQLRDVERFRRAGTLAGTRLDIEEAVIRQARDLVRQAKELTSSVTGTPAGDPLRQAVSDQLRLIHDQLVSLGNTRIGDEYLFAGGLTTTPPFLADGTYVGDSTVRRAVVDDGVTVDTSHTGNTLFGSAFAALQSAQANLMGGTTPQLQASLGALHAAGQDLLTREAENGARQSAVVRALDSVARRGVELVGSRERVAGVAPAEAALELVSAQNALERAYASVARILSGGLTDFLR